MGAYKCLDFTCYDGISNDSSLSCYYRKDRSMARMKITILVVFLLLCVACTKKTFIMDPSITYPEERNVVVAVPVVPVDIEILE